MSSTLENLHSVFYKPDGRDKDGEDASNPTDRLKVGYGFLSTNHIDGFKPDNYESHLCKLSADSVPLDHNMDRIVSKPGIDSASFGGKGREKTERMLRLGVHSLSYSDWCLAS